MKIRPVMICHPRKRPGFSLVELLIVVALMAIIAGALLPSSNAGIPQQLESAARIVARDMAYCRSLAVSNNSKYQVVFHFTKNRYKIIHAGTDSTLDALPPSVFRKPGDPPDRHIVNLADLPLIGTEIQLNSVFVTGGTTRVLEYGPLGETAQSDETVIWLAAGAENNRRYISIHVHPITGIATIGPVQATLPTAEADKGSSQGDS